MVEFSIKNSDFYVNKCSDRIFLEYIVTKLKVHWLKEQKPSTIFLK